MNGKNYKREETWGDMFERYDEDATSAPPHDETGTFAELFASTGMKGFKPKEQDKKSLLAEGHLPRYPQAPQDKLDLHGMTVEEAEREVQKFILECRERRLVFVLIVTGKGLNSLGGSPKLRPLTLSLLTHMIEEHLVKDFKSANPDDGGFGALYVYLK